MRRGRRGHRQRTPPRALVAPSCDPGVARPGSVPDRRAGGGRLRSSRRPAARGTRALARGAAPAARMHHVVDASHARIAIPPRRPSMRPRRSDDWQVTGPRRVRSGDGGRTPRTGHRDRACGNAGHRRSEPGRPHRTGPAPPDDGWPGEELGAPGRHRQPHAAVRASGYRSRAWRPSAGSPRSRSCGRRGSRPPDPARTPREGSRPAAGCSGCRNPESTTAGAGR